MIARPARVRIRNRKPCVRARRRLFGWKVRLPFATVTTPSCPSRSQPAPPTPYLHDACDVVRRFSPLILLTRHRRGTYEIWDFIPDNVRVAAVPPTFGRLFEGTDLLDAGQTGHVHHDVDQTLRQLSRTRRFRTNAYRPHLGRCVWRRGSGPNLSAITPSGTSRARASSPVYDHSRHSRIPAAQESVTFGETCHRCLLIGWRGATKTVSFCECRFHRAHASEPPTRADADRGRTPTSRSPGTGDPR